MAIIKSVKKQNLELRRENERLKNKAAKQQEMLEFLGILNDVDIEDLMDESGEGEEIENG